MFYILNVESDSPVSSPSPNDELKVGPLHLANALSACVLSCQLPTQHRQWAAHQLVSSLALLRTSSTVCLDNLVDLSGDMPACPESKLEAHQNRLTECTWNHRKRFLATR